MPMKSDVTVNMGSMTIPAKTRGMMRYWTGLTDMV